MKKMMMVLFAVSLIATGCTKQQESTAAKGDAPNAAQAQAKLQSDAMTAKAQVEAQAKDAAQKVQDTAQKAAADAKAAASSMVSKIQDLLAQAKQLIDQGKLNEAITVAQQVLSMDPNNIDAKNLIETAKAKIAALAQQKAGDIKAGLTNTLGAIGK